MSYFIFFHAVGGLDGDAAGVKRDGFADQTMTGAPGFGLAGVYVTTMKRGGSSAALGDAEQRAHFQVGDFLFVEDFDSEAGFLGHGFRLFSARTARR